MRHGWVTAIALAAASCHAPSAPRATAHPKLVVLIVVEQLPTWAFEQQRSLFTAGFARLLRDGVYVRAADIPYATTLTAPGHAAIATGAPPSVTGIVGDAWYRRLDGHERPAEYDPDAEVLPIAPALGKDELKIDLGASANALRVEGVADILRRASLERSRSVAIALEARSACFVAGKRPDLAVWYEPAAGGMTTSRAYADEPPAWLKAFAAAHPVSAYFAQSWQPGDPAQLARFTGSADDAPGEGSKYGLGAVFPHSLAMSDAPEKALAQTPFADDLVLQTALAALDATELGKDDIPDLLAISLGAHELAGRAWGPNSWEAVDLTLRLDRSLGVFFDALDHKLGKNGWAVVVTSDHGATPLPESSKSLARRISPKEIASAAEAVLDRRLGGTQWVANVSSNQIYFVQAFAQLPAETRDDALTAAAHAIQEVPGIAAAGRVDDIARGCDRRADLERAICLSMVSDEAGDLYAYPQRGSMISESSTGTGHDAPYDDDREVPILVMAPGLAPQHASGSLLQVAPTLAALLGVPAPEAAKLPPLFGLRAR